MYPPASAHIPPRAARLCLLFRKQRAGMHAAEQGTLGVLLRTPQAGGENADTAPCGHAPSALAMPDSYTLSPTASTKSVSSTCEAGRRA